ncbi:MAG: Eco57I restriction-modification methylase domain-containing protein [Anaerolineaceae bacterium]|jgi:hypothetical protein
MAAPETIHNLVSRFRDSRELLNSAHYNETQLRIEFLNPLFIELGWDVYNERNIALQYRDVIHEDSLEIEGTTRAPDYAFCVGTSRKFFVEAKKPSARIVTNAEAAYQLRRYAWNAKLPLSILTDFEHFAVYDCRNRPDPKDSAATGRVLLYNFEEYLSHWDEIAKIFSKQAVWSGAFDKFADGTKGKRGTTEVDAEFLKEIEAWRDLLARNIALRNFRSSEELANLPRAERQLNYAVQATIDRLLFLRISEDREIEPPEQLLQISRQPDIYANLIKLFKHADQKYNSGLFHFSEEKSQTSAPDTFTPTLQIDDKVLRQIIESLYYPCPYIFREIPVEILGQVYEQFLGKVIRLTPKGIAKVEEKPEVRKAGGVYYTPSYIVDYIVHNTLGPLLHPDQPSSDLSSRDPQGRGDLPLQPLANQTPDNQLESSSQTPSRDCLRPGCSSQEGELKGLLASWVLSPGVGLESNSPINGKEKVNGVGLEEHPSKTTLKSGSFDLSSRDPQGRGDLPLQPLANQTPDNQLESSSQTPSSEAQGGGKGAACVLGSVSRSGSFDLSSRDPQGRGDLPLQPLANQTPDNQLESSSQTPSSEAQGGGKGAACVLGSVPRSGSFDLSSRDPQGRGDLPFQPSANQTPDNQLELSSQNPSSEATEAVGRASCPLGIALVNPTSTSLTPDQALKLRVVDPACGSGSFLLGAYQYLLDWHLNYYLTHDPESHIRGKNPPIVATEGGEYRLTTEEKKRILTASIYGVDIDAQAVEVTKLSLLLKLLEGETGQLTLGFDRVLPDLGNNIRCGNSLIGWDYFASQLLPDEEEIIRVNPFDWQRSFPEVFAQGGFDAVIGNPPYGADLEKAMLDNLVLKFESFKKVKDIYIGFIEKGIDLIKPKGLLAFIIPSAWMGGPAYIDLRRFLLQQEIKKLILLPFDVFKDAYVDTSIIVVKNITPQDKHSVLTYEYPKRERILNMGLLKYDQQEQASWNYLRDNKFVLSSKLTSLLLRFQDNFFTTLNDYCLMRRGVLFDKKLLKDHKISEKHFPYFEGDVYRYEMNIKLDRWIEFGDKLKERPKDFSWFEGERILVRRLVSRQQRIMASFTDRVFITNKNLYSVIPRNIDVFFLLGLINSRLFSFLYIKQVTQASKDDFPQVTIKDFLSLPIPKEFDEDLVRSVSTLVKNRLALSEQTSKLPFEEEKKTERISLLESELDNIVYKLYGLSKTEVDLLGLDT